VAPLLIECAPLSEWAALIEEADELFTKLATYALTEGHVESQDIVALIQCQELVTRTPNADAFDNMATSQDGTINRLEWRSFWENHRDAKGDAARRATWAKTLLSLLTKRVDTLLVDNSSKLRSITKKDDYSAPHKNSVMATQEQQPPLEQEAVSEDMLLNSKRKLIEDLHAATMRAAAAEAGLKRLRGGLLSMNGEMENLRACGMGVFASRSRSGKGVIQSARLGVASGNGIVNSDTALKPQEDWI